MYLVKKTPVLRDLTRTMKKTRSYKTYMYEKVNLIEMVNKRLAEVFTPASIIFTNIYVLSIFLKAVNCQQLAKLILYSTQKR